MDRGHSDGLFWDVTIIYQFKKVKVSDYQVSSNVQYIRDTKLSNMSVMLSRTSQFNR